VSPVKQLLSSAILTLALFLSACGSGSTSNPQSPQRTFQTSFKSVEDIQGFYIVSQNHMNSASHGRLSEKTYTEIILTKAGFMPQIRPAH